MTLNRECLWEEILSIAAIPERICDDEVSAREFAERSKMGWSAANSALNRLVDEGKMQRRRALLRSGKRGYAYRLVTGSDDSHE